MVDYHAELIEELRRSFNRRNMQFIRNAGTDFPGVPDNAIDFLFSFGCFVHLDPPLIMAYLANMRRILKAKAIAVVHYSDQNKILAQLNSGFSDNTPERMRKMIQDAGFQVVEEDLTTMWHSSIVRFTKA